MQFQFMNIFTMIANALMQLVGGDPVHFLIWVLFILGTIWLFKEVKKITINDKSLTVTRIDQALEIYGRLESSIMLYLKARDVDSQRVMYEKIGESYSVISNLNYS